MNDEPSKIEETVTDAAKAIQVASAGQKAVAWIWATHMAVWGGIRSTAHRFSVNAHDWIKVNWATIYGAIGSVTLMICGYVQDYVVPSLQNGGLQNILIAMAVAGFTQFVISLLTGGKAPVKRIQPPVKAVPPDTW